MEGLVLLDGILHSSICCIGKHVLREDMFLLQTFSYRWACLTYQQVY